MYPIEKEYIEEPLFITKIKRTNKVTYDENDLSYILILERLTQPLLSTNILRSCIKKTDKQVLRYFKKHGSVYLFRKLIEIFIKYTKNDGLESPWSSIYMPSVGKPKIEYKLKVDAPGIYINNNEPAPCDCEDCVKDRLDAIKAEEEIEDDYFDGMDEDNEIDF